MFFIIKKEFIYFVRKLGIISYCLALSTSTVLRDPISIPVGICILNYVNDVILLFFYLFIFGDKR